MRQDSHDKLNMSAAAMKTAARFLSENRSEDAAAGAILAGIRHDAGPGDLAGTPSRTASAAIERLSSSLASGDGQTHIRRLEIVARACGFRSWHAAEGRKSSSITDDRWFDAFARKLSGDDMEILQRSMTLDLYLKNSPSLKWAVNSGIRPGGPDIEKICFDYRMNIASTPIIPGDYPGIDLYLFKHIIMDGPFSAIKSLERVGAPDEEKLILTDFMDALSRCSNGHNESDEISEIYSRASRISLNIKDMIRDAGPRLDVSADLSARRYALEAVSHTRTWNRLFLKTTLQYVIYSSSSSELYLASKTPGGISDIKRMNKNFEIYVKNGFSSITSYISDDGGFFSSIAEAEDKMPSLWPLYCNRFLQAYQNACDTIVSVMRNGVPAM